jgi:hypothetical protein
MRQINDRLEGKRLVVAKPYHPSSVDNRAAWAAIQPLLAQAGPRGVGYELLAGAARAAARSVGSGFIAYLVDREVLSVTD